jgi:hypothetical protein
VVLAADYPFLDIFWTMLIFFCWVIWVWMVITVFIDVFRRDDFSGWAKAAWSVLIIVLPFLGVFGYLITQGGGMAERKAADMQAGQAAIDDRIRSVAATGGATDEIARAKALLDSGAIDQAEFEQLKRKALA